MVPSVYIVHDPLCGSFAMHMEKVLLDPSNEMVLECALDELMEEVRGEKLIYVGVGEVTGEWL